MNPTRDEDEVSPFTPEALAALASALTSFEPSKLPDLEPLEPDNLAGHERRVNEVRTSIELHQTEMELFRQLEHAVMATVNKLRDRKRSELIELENSKAQLAKAKYLDAERQLADGLKPDLSNPELQRLMKLLEGWENYARMDDYQVEDVVFTLDRWLKTRDQINASSNIYTRGIINANDTGMGKTLETIAFLYVMRQVNPAANIIWFTKTSLVKETAPESSMKWGFSMIPVLGNTPDKLAMIRTMKSFVHAMPLTLIMNYECVNQNEIMAEINATQWDFMVIDEVHKLRGGANYKPTQMWANTKKFKQSSNAWPMMLSGSIINNRARELWAFLNIMDEERFPDVAEFEATMKVSAVYKQQLTKILAPSMFRRTKAEVNIKMPERVIRHHILEFDDPILKQVYNTYADRMFAWLENQEGKKKSISAKSILDQLIRLRVILVAPGYIKVPVEDIDPMTGELVRTGEIEQLSTGTPDKLNYVCELADELTMEGQQVVIASSGFKPPLDYIAEHINPLVKSEKLYGGNSAIGGDISARFKSGETQVILTNLQTGAEGFNLHKNPKEWPGGAEHLIMIDDWYNPELVRQMWDRVWRRGSPNRVVIHVIQMDNTVDSWIEQVRENKALTNGKITESTVLRAGEWIDTLKKALGR